MPLCPVCETRFVNGKTTTCPICNWDIQELSLMVGLIPEVSEKEATRLAWAKKQWQTLQHHQSQLQLLQGQLHQAESAARRSSETSLPSVQVESASPAPKRSSETSLPSVQVEAPVASAEQTTEISPPSPLSPPSSPSPSHPPTAPRRSSETSLPVGHAETPAIQSPTLPLSPTLPHSPTSPLPHSPTPLLTHPPTPTLGNPIDEWLLAPALMRSRPLALPPLPPSCEPQTLQFESVTLTATGRSMQAQTATAFNLPLSSEVGLEMVVIPGGKFWMGSPETEPERDPNEGPRHLVAIASFSLSQFPITQAQWRIVASWPKVKRSLSLYPADFEGDDRPVEQVTWYDCMEFCARLSQYAGQTYRLPSEAEWEYACRAGTTTPFHCGETLAPDLANYDGNFVYGEGATGAYRQQTTSIRNFRYANPLGLFDMHGNVWEWCLDSWHDSYQEAPVDGRAWEDLDQPYHVLRGGAWYCLPGLCRSAQRHWNQPDTGGSGIGFRVVCEID